MSQRKLYRFREVNVDHVFARRTSEGVLVLLDVKRGDSETVHRVELEFDHLAIYHLLQRYAEACNRALDAAKHIHRACRNGVAQAHSTFSDV